MGVPEVVGDIIGEKTQWDLTSMTLPTLDATSYGVLSDHIRDPRCSSRSSSITVLKTSRVQTHPLIYPFNIAWLVPRHTRCECRAVTKTRAGNVLLEWHKAFKATVGKFSQCEKLLS